MNVFSSDYLDLFHPPTAPPALRDAHDMQPQRQRYEQWFAKRCGPRRLADEAAALSAADAYDALRLDGRPSKRHIDLLIAAASDRRGLVWRPAGLHHRFRNSDPRRLANRSVEKPNRVCAANSPKSRRLRITLRTAHVRTATATQIPQGLMRIPQDRTRQVASPPHSPYTHPPQTATIHRMDDTITISLSHELMSQLQVRASAEGVDVLTFAGRALQREATRPLLDDILKPVRDAFLASGMTDDELGDLLEVEKHAMRGVPYDSH